MMIPTPYKPYENCGVEMVGIFHGSRIDLTAGMSVVEPAARKICAECDAYYLSKVVRVQEPEDMDGGDVA